MFQVEILSKSEFFLLVQYGLQSELEGELWLAFVTIVIRKRESRNENTKPMFQMEFLSTQECIFLGSTGMVCNLSSKESSGWHLLRL